MPDDPTLGGGQPAVIPAAPIIPTPAPDTTNWKAKFEGAQGTWQQERDRANQLAIANSELNQKLVQAQLEATEGVTKHKTAAEAAITEATDYKSKFEKSQQKLGVMALLNTDEFRMASQIYGDEASLESLINMPEDARKVHLAKVVTTITGLADQQRIEAARGSVPPVPGNPPPPGQDPKNTLADAKKNLDVMYRTKGPQSPEYAAARDAYYAGLMSTGK